MGELQTFLGIFAFVMSFECICNTEIKAVMATKFVKMKSEKHKIIKGRRRGEVIGEGSADTVCTT